MIVFAAVCAVTMLLTGGLLQFPAGTGGTWIMVIESAALISIGLTLGLLYFGGRPNGGSTPTRNHTMPDADYRIYALAGVALFAIGFYSLLVQAHLLRRIMALNVMGSGVFLVYIALGAQTPGPIPDPVPHAMVLTGIVVSVCATGLALALADRVQAAAGEAEPGDDA